MERKRQILLTPNYLRVKEEKIIAIQLRWFALIVHFYGLKNIFHWFWSIEEILCIYIYRNRFCSQSEENRQSYFASFCGRYICCFVSNFLQLAFQAKKKWLHNIKVKLASNFQLKSKLLKRNYEENSLALRGIGKSILFQWK